MRNCSRRVQVMAEHNKNDAYDVIIIGAGISGLVCGCYLAKAGMKALIVEQHTKPGGYCASFRRNNFLFDAAAHSFGGYREGGLVRRVFRELGIDAHLNIIRHDPTDVVNTPQGRIPFRTNREETIAEFQSAFHPEAGNIKTFFRFIDNPPKGTFAGSRSLTFGDLLDRFFKDEKLKAVLAYPLLGNCGVPPSSLSAFIGCQIFREFLIDGGYYPAGGMQTLSNALAAVFREAGGELRLSSRVRRIVLEQATCAGVALDDETFVPADIVVSSADARLTFFELLGQKELPEAFRQKLSTMIQSLSMFVVYLGIDSSFKELPDAGTNIWFLPHYDLDALYQEARSGSASNVFMLRVVPDQQSIIAFAQTSFRTEDYWHKNKQTQLELYLKTIETNIIPGLSEHIIFQNAATPATLLRYTLNYQGASYGWEATPDQLALRDFHRPSFVQGLYLSGHWTTQGLGIPGVIYGAADTAKSLLKRCKPRESMIE